jgi:hypothetical protein
MSNNYPDSPHRFLHHGERFIVKRSGYSFLRARPGRGLPDSCLSVGHDTAYQFDVKKLKVGGKSELSVERMIY